MKKLKVLFIAQDIGSTEMGMGYRSYMFAKLLKERGHEVHLLTASYSHVRRQNPKVEKNLEIQSIEGMNYQFIKCFNFSGSLIKRALNMLYFSALLFLQASSIKKTFQADIVIASSPHPLIIWGAERIAKLSSAELIFEVRDIWPLSLTETGHVKPSHPFIQLLQFAEDYAYKNSKAVISLLSNAYEHMKTRQLPREKYHFIPNGVSLKELNAAKPLNEKTLAQIETFKQKFPFVMGYAGAHGIMNSLGQAIEAMSLAPNLGLILLGSGPEKEKLFASAQTKANILFLDSIPKNEVPSFLEHIEVAFIGLQSSPLFKYGISPNKLIDYMACAKPVLMAIDCKGDPVEASGCGVKVKAGDSKEIAHALIAFSQKSKSELQSTGELGKIWIYQNLDYSQLIVKFEALMLSAISPSTSQSTLLSRGQK